MVSLPGVAVLCTLVDKRVHALPNELFAFCELMLNRSPAIGVIYVVVFAVLYT